MTDAPRKPKKGCLFYLLLVGAVSIVVLLFGAYLGVRYAKKLVNQLTDAQPMRLPTVQLPEAQMFQLHDRVDSFREAVRDGDPAPPLALSPDELNALIETDPAMEALKNHLFVSITNSELHAQISFPAEDLGFDALRGRYINATGVFDVAVTNGALGITAESLMTKGKPIPRHIMRQIATQNLATKFNQDPHATAGLNKIQSVEVKDGKLVITPKK
jgi:hypothetical protein